MSVVQGDCIDVLPDLEGRADLIYVDPPFFTQREHISSAGNFDDRFDGMQGYLEWMQPRLLAMRHALARDGVLVVHADDHAWHYLAVILDGIFEVERPWAIVCWKRTSAHGDTTRRYGRIHDTLIFYTAPQPPPIEPFLWDLWYPDEWFLYEGHGLFDVDLIELGQRVCDRLWRILPRDAELPLRRPPSSPRTFHPPEAGDAASNLWLDIRPAGSFSKERTGYPTQKPEALLERIIRTLTDPGDLVIDPMCGSGTALAVARRLGRRAFGCDISADAVKITAERLETPIQTALLSEVAS